MKLILHIGMGKTGSSALQAALRSSKDTLVDQGAEYLGMWFDMLSPRYKGLANQEKFFNQSNEELAESGRRLLEVFEERRRERGITTFILSNEAFSGHAHVFRPILDVLLANGVDVLAIGYARDPASWLPSAYVQWGVRDKVNMGPVPPYAEKATELVNWYRGLIAWKEMMNNKVEIRPYDQADDIVQDFADSIGLKLELPSSRVLERGEDVEILLRAIFNNRFQEHVLPQRFDRVVLPARKQVISVDEMAARSLDYRETSDIIQKAAPLFDDFTKKPALIRARQENLRRKRQISTLSSLACLTTW